VKILWIALVWPEPDSSAAGTRTIQLLQCLKKAGHDVVVSSPCQTNKYRDSLEAQGFRCEHHAPNDPRFDLFLKQVTPQVVFFDRFMIEEQFSWRVREHCPDALRVLDTIDLHFLRRGRERAVQRGESAQTLCDSEKHSDDTLRELAAIYRSDLSLIIAGTELQLLRNEFQVPEFLIALCAFSRSRLEEVPTFDKRAHCVAIGNFNHPPNKDSAALLRDGLWGRIRERLCARGVTNPELHLYGSYAPPANSRLDSPATGFRVMGHAPDAALTLSKYRVNLAPLRFGAGVKGKIVDGWAGGTPCAATPLAAEGMMMCARGRAVFGGVLESDWELFAESTAELYCDEGKWKNAQGAGFEVLEQCFNAKHNEAVFIESLSRSLKARHERRLQNTVGAMLWYQGNRSTEYFSRWIEAKNSAT
jgi:hypothetical protein